MQTIHLEPNQVPPQLAKGYSGKVFKASVTETLTIPADAGLWDSGSRDKYSAVRLADGTEIDLPGQKTAPWDRSPLDRTVTLQPGIVVKMHSIVCGKDRGLTFYIHPLDAAPMLPSKAELTANERTILEATAAYKSSYMGRDRYDIARENHSWNADPFMTREQWEAGKAALIERKLLNKAGAITVAGRNAIPAF